MKPKDEGERGGVKEGKQKGRANREEGGNLKERQPMNGVGDHLGIRRVVR